MIGAPAARRPPIAPHLQSACGRGVVPESHHGIARLVLVTRGPLNAERRHRRFSRGATQSFAPPCRPSSHTPPRTSRIPVTIGSILPVIPPHPKNAPPSLAFAPACAMLPNDELSPSDSLTIWTMVSPEPSDRVGEVFLLQRRQCAGKSTVASSSSNEEDQAVTDRSIHRPLPIARHVSNPAPGNPGNEPIPPDLAARSAVRRTIAARNEAISTVPRP
jgi:hypothetical protein